MIRHCQEVWIWPSGISDHLFVINIKSSALKYHISSVLSESAASIEVSHEYRTTTMSPMMSVSISEPAIVRVTEVHFATDEDENNMIESC